MPAGKCPDLAPGQQWAQGPLDDTRRSNIYSSSEKPVAHWEKLLRQWGTRNGASLAQLLPEEKCAPTDGRNEHLARRVRMRSWDKGCVSCVGL
uniref:Uncharacterized protein n=1 Tax=Trichuris muris TaxID=70415 RepID=A0A5S6QW20_TRIMR